jgi:prepilin-type N-terminal cleavage/methylation domain-containing protein
MIRSPRAPQATSGYTLVEIMISLVILSFGAVILGQLMLQASRASRVRSTATYRTAALTQQVERLGVIPFDSLTVGASCTSVTAAPFPHSLCTTVSSVSTVSRQATVVVTPSGGGTLPPDTAVVFRTQPIRTEPLSTP